MSYNALVLQVLVSGPGDFPETHREVVMRAVRLWNNTQSRFFGIHFSTNDWREGGTPEFGEYAQSVLNEQIVDDSDMAIVVFTDRMGSPTPDHPSGTAEEIERLRAAGKDVAVLLNLCARPPLTSAAAITQKAELEQYLETVRSTAFISSYDDLQRLAEVLAALLSRVATKYRREAEAALTEQAAPVPTEPLAGVEPDPADGVWPRVQVSENLETDIKGRSRTKRRWSLVLESNMRQPVTDVSYRYEDGDGQPLTDFDLWAERAESVDILPPLGSASFNLLQVMGSPTSAMCVVSWRDSAGVARETRATVSTR